MKGETDELPEVMTKGSCSGSDLSISGTWPAFRTKSWSSASSGLDYYNCHSYNDDIISNKVQLNEKTSVL